MKNQNSGFTVIEMFLVIIILGIAVSIVLVSLSKLNTSQVLEKNTALVVSILDQARSQTFSALGDSQYGVYFEATQLTLFKGATYSSSNPDNIVTVLDNRVGVRDITLTGGGSATVFKRLTGSTDQAGTLKVFLQDATTTFRTVRVSATGIVSVDSP